MIPDRVHITGASGSGTTTLARGIAIEHGHRQIDTDDFYWLGTDPPYTTKRPPDEPLSLLRAELASTSRWALAGSLCGWGDPLIPDFQLVVFILVPQDVRLPRLRAREVERYGAEAVVPGGLRYEAAEGFLAWAALYDDGGLDVRSRALHEDWLKEMECPVVRLDGNAPVAELVTKLEQACAKAV